MLNDYVVVRNFLAKDEVSRMKMMMDNTKPDHTEPHSFYGNAHGFYGLHYRHLEDLTDKVSDIVGKNLEPTYAYSRIYFEGSKLPPHIDRPACEYSVTLNIFNERETWDIYMDGDPVTLESGDAVIYKGCDVKHWRDECSSTTYQVFFHYVDADGEFANEAYEYLKASYVK